MTPLVTLTAAELRATAADDAQPRRPIRRARTLQVTGTTPEQQARWKDAAARQGMTLAAWMRAACDKFASSDT